MTLKLHTLVTSTRPGRAGIHVARWFHEVASSHGRFEAELVDLADFNLPVYDEPHHPRLRRYEHAHTLRWSESVNAADAFVFVCPEYNYGPTPALVNALNYVYHEWHYKPVAFVSYGGASGGLRGVQSIKPVVTTLRMMPLPEGVMLPFVAQQIGSNGFAATEPQQGSAIVLLDELLRWAEALKRLRPQA
jgi:NAD(P)H-dependent FMN reductase